MHEARLFSDSYDQIDQRRIAPALDQPLTKSTVTTYVGRLRLDLLLNRTLVLSEGQLLDGRFFLKLGPEYLTEVLSRQFGLGMPIEVRARSEDLAESLLRFFVSHQDQYLKPQALSILTEPERDTFVREIVKCRSNLLRTWEDVPRLIGEILGRPDLSSLLTERWDPWFRAARAGHLQVVRWQGQADYFTSLRYEEDAVLPILSNDEFRTMATEVLHGVQNRALMRSEMDTMFSRLLAQSLTKSEEQDVEILKSWVNRAFNRALSAQYSCHYEWSSVRPDQTNIIIATLAKSLGVKVDSPRIRVIAMDPWLPQATKIDVSVPQNFLVGLANMPSHEFHALWRRALKNLQSWWEDGSLDELRRGIDPFVEWISRNETEDFATDSAQVIASIATAPLKVAPLVGVGIERALGQAIGKAIRLILGSAIENWKTDTRAWRVMEYAQVLRLRA